MPLTDDYATAAEAALFLGVRPLTVSNLCASGRLRAEKVANRWLIQREVLEEFSKTYEGRPGRPRIKRKYIKRSTKWSNQL